MNILKKTKEVLISNIKKSRLLYRFFVWLVYDRKNQQKFGLTYNPLDITNKYYQKIKKTKDRELEHQIGRLVNFKEIISNCNLLPGSFIEFGTWKGFSLLWIAYFMDRNAIFNKKLIGLDGFVGLPYSDGVFNKFAFSDTSLKKCRKNILGSSILSEKIKKNIYIDKFLYNQKAEITSYLKNKGVKKFCFIHIDCDVSQSAKEIFDILIKGNLIGDKCYILFDDYGCESKLKFTINKIFKRLKSTWKIKTHSQTNLTKNFYFERRG